MSKHTPGPWEAKHRAGHDNQYRTEIFSAEHGGIATCAWTPKNCGNGVTGTYREANARLIAAAPDLLEALQAARSELWRLLDAKGIHPKDIRQWPEALKADAAIAKATGEQS